MSDSRLRELECTWRETGTLEDEAAWLRARVQSGELAEGRLETAAAIGLPAPVSVLGCPPPNLDHESVIAILQGFSREAAERAGIAAARFVLPKWFEACPADRIPAWGIESVEEWLALNGDLRDAEETRDQFTERRSPFLVPGAACRANYADQLGHRAAYSAGKAAQFVHSSLYTHDESLLSLMQGVGDYAHEALTGDSLAIPKLIEAMRGEVGPWLLDQKDPLRERVEAREKAAEKAPAGSICVLEFAGQEHAAMIYRILPGVPIAVALCEYQTSTTSLEDVRLLTNPTCASCRSSRLWSTRVGRVRLTPSPSELSRLREESARYVSACERDREVAAGVDPGPVADRQSPWWKFWG